MAPIAGSGLIDKRLEAGEYYEAFQLLQTVSSRFKSKKTFVSMEKMVASYSERLSACQQHDLAIELVFDLVKSGVSVGILPNQKHVAIARKSVAECPANQAPKKHQMLTSLLKWLADARKAAADGENDEGTAAAGRETRVVELTKLESETRLIIADVKCREKDYGGAQNHLVLCVSRDERAIHKLCGMMWPWQRLLYPSETDLLPLRCVLILLSRNEVRAAGEVIRSLIKPKEAQLGDEDEEELSTVWFMERKSEGDAFVPLPGLQLAYFLVAACEGKSLEFFHLLLKTKYKLVLRRDPCFDSLCELIEKNVFGVEPEGSPTDLLGSLLSGMMPAPAAVG